MRLNNHLLCCVVCSTLTTFAHSEVVQHEAKLEDSTQPVATTPTLKVLSAIPNLIESLPTLLPEQSNNNHIPAYSPNWVDKTHQQLKQHLTKNAQSINQWFGENDPDKPANAHIRLMIDGSWSKYEHAKIKPRVRGKIRLPALEKRLSLVFGDDSLDDELQDNVAISNQNPLGDPDKTFDKKQSTTDNNSVALRWSDWFTPDLFETDADLGLRSRDDVYARLKLSKSWQLGHHLTTRAEQVYRYGLHSKNYLRTNLEMRHQIPDKAFLANQLTLTYAEQNKQQGLSWENRLFRQHAFFHDQRFSYGVYSNGAIKDTTWQLDRYGPFVAWRQPFLRDWFFIQSDLNYLNDRKLNHTHYFATFVRAEAIF